MYNIIVHRLLGLNRIRITRNTSSTVNKAYNVEKTIYTHYFLVQDDPFVTNKPYEPKCGQHNPNDNELFVRVLGDGSIDTSFAEWPHVCILYFKNQTIEKFVGGASLIAPGVILTAAHKVEYVFSYRVFDC